jgi:hypothetical protein
MPPKKLASEQQKDLLARDKTPITTDNTAEDMNDFGRLLISLFF